jgi:neurotransmitter:Na+ symporter, NSS family
MTAKVHENWSSNFGFLMAAIGFAVGLGNIWRFPYITGEHGGGAFVLVYVVCVFAIGVPILMAEIFIGRRGRLSPPGSMRAVAEAEGRSLNWQWAGRLNLLAAFLIEVVYCVVAGWVLWYLYQAITTGFTGVDAAAANDNFSGLLVDVPRLMFWTLMGLAFTGTIIFFGVQNGIERAVRVMMPTLFVLLLLLVAYNAFAGGLGAAADYLLRADFSKVNGPMVLAAIGQAFFSVGVAMAGMMTFGAYLPPDISISRSVLIIICADTLVALVAGFVIFPAVFKFGLDPSSGAGLIFQTMPVAFAQMPGGHLVSIAFFLLLSVAAITSMVGLIEPVVSWLEEHRGFTRHGSAMLAIGSVAVLSVICVLGYNQLSDWLIFGKNINDLLDYLTNNIMLPLGGLLIAVFAGWAVSRRSAEQELDMSSTGLFSLWRLLIRYLVPPALLLILVFGILG